MSTILNQDGTERKQYLKSTFPLIIVNWSLCCVHQNLLSGHHYLHNGSKKVGSDEEDMNGSINHTTSWLHQNKTNVELHLTVESYEIRKQMRHK
jgi:hypothetical protein